MTVYRIKLEARQHATFLAEQRKDPITKEPLCAGMEIVICAKEKVAFTANNWEGQCPLCGCTDTLSIIPQNTLPSYLAKPNNSTSTVPTSSFPSGSDGRHDNRSGRRSSLSLVKVLFGLAICMIGGRLILTWIAQPSTTIAPVSEYTSIPVAQITVESTELVPNTPIPMIEILSPVEVPQKKFAVHFVINSVEAEAGTIKFFISIERTGSSVLQWYADNAPESKDTIFLLQASGRVFHLIDTGGVFAQDTGLQPGETYSGWISFDRPEDNQFTFHYPEMEPVLITLSQTSSR
jgi:hypothetical protein